MTEGAVGTPTAERLADAGLRLPDGSSIVSYDERPDLDDAIDAHMAGIFQPFMNEDPIANRAFRVAYESFPEFQLILLDAVGGIVAVANAMPLSWDRTDDGLPEGWDDQVLRSVADRDAGHAANTLGAMLIVVNPALRGGGFAGTMVGAFRAAARAASLGAVIACVRPTEKERYPLMSIESYAAWRRHDGLPFDPWMRLHARLGGRVVRPSPRSMTVRGTIADWQGWTGLQFPESGQYVVTGATSTVTIDLERDEGLYHDQNVWMVHDLA
jgi:hypothetical protein